MLFLSQNVTLSSFFVYDFFPGSPKPASLGLSTGATASRST